jgi:hypothetical protein
LLVKDLLMLYPKIIPNIMEIMIMVMSLFFLLNMFKKLLVIGKMFFV